MTAQVDTPEPGPVAAGAAVVRHTYDCARCKATGRVCIQGRRLRQALATGREQPTVPRVNGGTG
ncbi:hypothetical protein ABZY36_31725 [Streptomyces sp. NPDC006627]|uniref:hypothetical protein n=1 Tax=Streptomyces sp. NPDC006627 TaxID=3154679 RepID=UPI0033B56222